MTGVTLTFSETMADLSRLAAECGQSIGADVDQAAQQLSRCLASGGRVLACGNGGSAADASHFAAELVGRFVQQRRALPVIALVGDSAVTTSIANDFGYSSVFARQVEAYGNAGDTLVGITTSGRSDNVLNAFETARRFELTTIALTGTNGDTALSACNVWVRIPSSNTQRIQEIHGAVLHYWCTVVEQSQMNEKCEAPIV